MFHYQKCTENMLVYVLEPGEELDRFSLHMLREQPVEGLLPVGVPGWTDPERENPDYVQTLLIPTAGCIPLEQYLQTAAEPSVVPPLLQQAVELQETLREYMIPGSELLLNIHFAYVHRKTGRLRLICLPAQNAGCLREHFRDFARAVYALALHENMTHQEDLLLDLYKLNDPSLTEEDLVEELLPLEKLNLEEYLTEDEETDSMTSRPQDKALETENRSSESRVEPLRETGTTAAGELGFFSPDGEEEVPVPAPAHRLGSRMKRLLAGSGRPDPLDDFCTPEAAEPEGACRHVLTVRSTGQEFLLPETVTLIGTDPATCHLCLKNNPFAEREHCRIFFAQGQPLVEDLNSDSGTWVNSAKLHRFEEQPLQSADIIRIGREELVYSRRYQL